MLTACSANAIKSFTNYLWRHIMETSPPPKRSIIKSALISPEEPRLRAGWWLPAGQAGESR